MARDIANKETSQTKRRKKPRIASKYLSIPAVY